MLRVPIVTTALLLGLGLATSADAGLRSPGTQARLDFLRPIAEQAFPSAVANCDSIAIVTGVSDPGHAGEAEHSQGTPDCIIRLAADWPEWDRSYLCALLVHEYGHLAGHDHSDEPGDVMFPWVGAEAWPPCAELWRLRHRASWVKGLLNDLRRAARRVERKLSRAERRRHPALHRRAGRIDRRTTERRSQLGELLIRLGP